MNRVSILLFVVMIMFVGCGGGIPNVKTSEKFQLKKVALKLTQSNATSVKYHTQEEMETLLNDSLTKMLEEKNLVSSDTSMNDIVINATYKRQLLYKNSLGYPVVSYTIKVEDDSNVITGKIRQDLTIQGGLAMNMKLITGLLKDKKYELAFIEALAESIVEDIEVLHN